MSDAPEFKGSARFRVDRLLGSGSMGVVYAAFDRDAEVPIAVKTLKRWGPESLFALKNEFRSLADLRHDNLVRLRELVCEGDEWFLTMEYVEGADFLSWVRASRPSFDDERLRHGLRQLASALVALHAAGKVHRDLKPTNILVTSASRVVVLDFGLVLDSGDDGASVSAISGTPAYMAPEQASMAAVGPPADLYALGVILYEALTGLLPFRGNSLEVMRAKQQREATPPSWERGGLPADLDEICGWLLQREPTARPSAAVLLELLGGSSPAPSRLKERLFVGRAAELRQLGEAFSQVRGGAPTAMVVEGESGIGKTSLARHFAEGFGEDPTALVFWGRCYERELMPFKAVDGVVDALTRHLARLGPVDAALVMPRYAACLVRLFPSFGRLDVLARATGAEVPADPRLLRERAFGALRELISRLSDRGPLLLVVDDFQWADRDSVQLFGELLRGSQPPRCLLLLLSRPEAKVVSEITAELGAMVRSVRLATLDAREATSLASALAKHRLVDAAQLARESAGHPLFLEELILQSHPGEATAKLEDVLRQRVKDLSPSARALLQAQAISVAPLQAEVLARAAGAGTQESDQQLDLLLSTRLLRRSEHGLECYHDRIRESVVASLDQEATRSWHRRLAVALEATGGDPPSLARHFEAAGEAPRAAQCAHDAAEQAAAKLAFDLSAEMYRMALRLGAHDPEGRRELTMKMGVQLSLSGRCAEAAGAYLQAGEGADVATALACTQRAAENLLESGRLEAGVAVLNRALEAEGERLPTASRAVPALLWNRARLTARGWKHEELATEEGSARQLGLLRVLYVASITIGFVDVVWGAAISQRFCVLALSSSARWARAYAFSMESIFRALPGRAAAVERFVAEAARLGHESSEPFVESFTQGVTQSLLGRYRAARDAFLEAERRYDPSRSNGMGPHRLGSTLLKALAYTGSYREFVQRAEVAIRDAERRQDVFSQIELLPERNLAHLVRDQPRQASQALQRVWQQGSAAAREDTAQEFFECQARVELALYRGDTLELLELRARLARIRRGRLNRSARVVRCLLLHSLGLIAVVTGDVTETGVIAAALEQEHLEVAEAWATLLRASLADLRGERTSAEALWRTTAERMSALGMEGLAAASRLRQGEAQGGDAGAALIAASQSWMQAQGIVDPARFARILAPRCSATFLPQ